MRTRPQEFQFPAIFSAEKSIGLLGNSINIACARYFLLKMIVKTHQSVKPFKFIDLFAGIGGFHITLNDFGECVLAVDNIENYLLKTYVRKQFIKARNRNIRKSIKRIIIKFKPNEPK